MLTKNQTYLLQIRDDPDNPQRITNVAAIDAWILRDVTSRNYIFATLSKPMKESLYSCETAAIMWTRLDTQYRLTAAENLHLLWQSFYDFTHHPDDDMTTHIRKLSSIADKLRELGQPLDEMQLVTKALATLPEQFRIVRSVWANVPLNERTVDNLLQRLRSEENVLRSYERPDGSNQDFAAYGQTRGRGSRGNRRGGRSLHGVNRQSPRPDVRCGYCFIPGHETKDCRKKKRAEREEQANKDQALLSSTSVNPKSVLAFFADSGATQHMSDMKTLFEDFIPIQPGSWSIAGIGDTHLQVLGKGHIRATINVNGETSTRLIEDVLYVPGLGTNLFSIGAATSSGLEARFSDDQVFFYHGNQLVLIGRRTGNTLYHLDLQPQTTRNKTTYHIDVAKQAGLQASLIVWHQRLGHMSHQTILKMVSQDLISGLHLTNEKIPKTLCTACELGKFHRQPLKSG